MAGERRSCCPTRAPKLRPLRAPGGGQAGEEDSECPTPMKERARPRRLPLRAVDVTTATNTALGSEPQVRAAEAAAQVGDHAVAFHGRHRSPTQGVRIAAGC
eukprot:7528275-Pyramimonas_sp.AAC.1